MALILCPECAKDVSDSARTCPHCGYNLARKKQVKRLKILLFIGFVALCVGGGFTINYAIEQNRRAHEAAQEFINRCHFETYSDAYHWLDQFPIDSVNDIYIMLRNDEIRGIPFKQSDLYTRWSYYRDHLQNKAGRQADMP